MGMFDYVIPECPMPSEARHVDGWQTKDFDCQMIDYRITAEGRLMREIVHYEDRSDPTAEPGTLASIVGMMTKVRDGWADMNHHGVVNFYTHSPGEGWLEFNATFTHGQLEKVERIDDRYPAAAPSSTEPQK